MLAAILLLLLPSVHKSQSTFSNNNNVPRLSTQSEVLLRRGSSYISLSSSLALTPGSLLGFSFKTCHGGGSLVTQHGAGDSVNSVILSLTAAGQLRLEIRHNNVTRSETVGQGLSDGAWHTVRVGVALGSSRVCLSVDTDVECDPPRSGPNVLNTDEDQVNVKRMEAMESLLTSLNLTGSSTSVARSSVVIGSEWVGCIREGPGLRFTTGNIDTSNGVNWGSCLMPDTCQGRKIQFTTQEMGQFHNLLQTICHPFLLSHVVLLEMWNKYSN